MLIESLFAAFPVYLRPIFIVARSDKEVPVSMKTGTSRMAIKFFPRGGISAMWVLHQLAEKGKRDQDGSMAVLLVSSTSLSSAAFSSGAILSAAARPSR